MSFFESETVYTVTLDVRLDVTVGVQSMDRTSAEGEAKALLSAILGLVLELDEHAVHGEVKSMVTVRVE